jgi:hypothetical protein
VTEWVRLEPARNRLSVDKRVLTTCWADAPQASDLPEVSKCERLLTSTFVVEDSDT